MLRYRDLFISQTTIDNERFPQGLFRWSTRVRVGFTATDSYQDASNLTPEKILFVGCGIAEATVINTAGDQNTLGCQITRFGEG